MRRRLGRAFRFPDLVSGLRQTGNPRQLFVVLRTMAPRAIRAVPTNMSSPDSGRIGVSLFTISGLIAPSGWAMATGTWVWDDGSAETAAATGRNAIISRPVVVAALRIARMLTSLPSLVRPRPPLGTAQSSVLSSSDVPRRKRPVFRVYGGRRGFVIRDMPSRDKQFLSSGPLNCRGSIRHTRGNVTNATRDRSCRFSPFSRVSAGCTVEIEN